MAFARFDVGVELGEVQPLDHGDDNSCEMIRGQQLVERLAHHLDLIANRSLHACRRWSGNRIVSRHTIDHLHRLHSPAENRITANVNNLAHPRVAEESLS